MKKITWKFHPRFTAHSGQKQTCQRREHPLVSLPMKTFTATLFALTTLATVNLTAADMEEGFVPLMDGKTFDGWKPQVENSNTWKIEDGAFVTKGNMCHLFYVGDEKPFKNFELKVDVKTDAGSNGGIYFHTKYQEKGWPNAGFECQVNQSQSDWIKTGSLYGLVNISQSLAQDWQWYTQHIIVQGNKVIVKIDGKIALEYNEPPGAQGGKDYSRKINEGTFALQAHDPKSVIRYKNIRVKRLD
jgi:hypothetical protein